MGAGVEVHQKIHITWFTATCRGFDPLFAYTTLSSVFCPSFFTPKQKYQTMHIELKKKLILLKQIRLCQYTH